MITLLERRLVHSRIEVTDGDTAVQLVVTGLTRAHHAVITRTGMVWMVGPVGQDAVIRIAGSHEPWPARVPRRPREPKPLAVAVDVTELWSRRFRTGMRTRSAVLVSMGALAALVILAKPPLEVVLIFTISLGVLMAVAVFLVRRRCGLARLPELVDAGPWTMAQVSLRPWKADPTVDSLAAARGTAAAGGGLAPGRSVAKVSSVRT